MNIILVGAKGKIGKVFAENLPEKHKIIEFVDKENSVDFFAKFKKVADVLVDFSHHSLTPVILEYGIKTLTPVVMGTTGHTEKENRLIEKASKVIPIFKSGNMSTSIARLIRSAVDIIKCEKNAEVDIIEEHHDKKADAPSGTALMIAEKIKAVKGGKIVYGNFEGARSPEDIVLHSLRKGSCVGKHRIIITTPNEIIEFEHQALSRNIFADGAITASEFLTKQKSGLYDICSL